jgi:phosphoglycerol transferase MdoB-like AlkP superfamily enzyme
MQSPSFRDNCVTVARNFFVDCGESALHRTVAGEGKSLASGWSGNSPRGAQRWRTVGSLLVTLVTAAVLVFLIELTVRGSLADTLAFFRTPDMPGWTTILLFALALVALDALLGRAHQALLVLGPLMLLMAWMSHEKAHYIGDPLYPVDFLYARQVVEILPLLARDRPLTMVGIIIVGILAAAALVAASVYWRRRFPVLSLKGRVWRLIVTLPLLLFFASIMDYSTFSWVRDRLQIIPMMWDQKENYAHNGFTAAFILNVPMANVKAPKGYSADTINNIPSEPAAAFPPEKPDIIIVMNESFWDPTRLPNTTITPDPIPTIRKNLSGHVFSPEFGGTTANIEFEALTGFSNAFLPYGSIPYQQYVRRPTPSLASFFRSEGYVTRALHPYVQWFWNRGTVYKDFGFDTFMSQEKLPPLAKRGPLVSDAAFFDEIMHEADEQTQPFFFFAVTLQNHGPYEPYRYVDPTHDVETKAGSAAKQSILTYAEGASDADKAFARLMQWASHRTRPTVIAMFGDHLPPLGPAYVETGFMKGQVAPRRAPVDEMRREHETPLVIWSNRTGVWKTGTISPSLVPLNVLEAAGITHPYYTGLLGQVSDHYRVVDRYMLITPDGSGIPDWSRNGDVDDVVNQFRYVQYDQMFGHHFSTRAFFPETMNAGS